MARTAKSQWEFADLLSPAAVPTASPPAGKVWSVADLTGQVRRILEKEFSAVWVSGEISNFRSQPSGHIYFVLKDASAQLSCVLFRGQDVAQRSQFRDGMQVLVGGELTVYEARGQYQLRVTSMELKGAGALHAAFERLKAKLAAEGLFDPARKRPIPRYPHRIGVVTSASTAALRDVLHVLSRRGGPISLVLANCRVQGNGAAEEIAAAIGRLNAWSSPGAPLDLILVTRGGGSLEDLWCFNEEIVARAIAESRIPVMSAVGHEIDFTIADFAADLRAATPSAAAELLTEGYVAAAELLSRLHRRLELLTKSQVNQARSAWMGVYRRLSRGHPRRGLDGRIQLLDDWQSRLVTAGQSAMEEKQETLASLKRRWLAVRPRDLLVQGTRRYTDLERRRILAAQQHLAQRQLALRRLADTLRLLSPELVLERGYSITRRADSGAVVSSTNGLTSGLRLFTRLATGEVESVVVPTDSHRELGSAKVR